MAITVSYNALVTTLDKELCITLRTTEDPIKFKRKLSQAKHRQAIDGKLIFSVATEADGSHIINVVLVPKRSSVEIIAVHGDGGL